MNGRIQVFARTPELGAVKTRLQPKLGEEGCYQLHQQLVRHTINNAVSSGIAPVEVWHTGNYTHPFWKEISTTFSVELRQQTGLDLGARMYNAVSSGLLRAPESPPQSKQKEEFAASDWVVLVGADCPAIDWKYLQMAASALESGEQVVIGPAQDGGYVLIGLRQPYEFLFRDIPWGSEQVMAATQARARNNNSPIYMLPALRDLDEWEDLEHYRSTQAWNSSAFLV